MVGGVQREDVERGAHEEEPDDAEQQIGRADDDVDGLRRAARDEPAGQKRPADQQVGDVVQRVDLEDPEQQSAVGRHERDTRGHGEAEQADDDVNGPEDGRDEAIG